MVNGQTGKVQGEAPISWWKVLLTVLIVLLLLACIFGAMVLFGESTGETSTFFVYRAFECIATGARVAVSTV
jgi:cell shape-determining protein MreD